MGGKARKIDAGENKAEKEGREPDAGESKVEKRRSRGWEGKEGCRWGRKGGEGKNPSRKGKKENSAMERI